MQGQLVLSILIYVDTLRQPHIKSIQNMAQCQSQLNICQRLPNTSTRPNREGSKAGERRIIAAILLRHRLGSQPPFWDELEGLRIDFWVVLDGVYARARFKTLGYVLSINGGTACVGLAPEWAWSRGRQTHTLFDDCAEVRAGIYFWTKTDLGTGLECAANFLNGAFVDFGVVAEVVYGRS
jgi:hypothetical protein